MLPEGFYDLLEDQVEREQALEQTLLSLLESFGYRRVAPSLVEYEDSLIDAQRAQREHCFRVVDSASMRMMAIRCDMTMQAARLAATRLSGETRPLRLSYAGTSLRTRTSASKPHRQFSQLGCEQFGAESPNAYAEILTLAAHALTRCGVEQPIVEIATPSVVRTIGDAHDLDEEQRNLLAKSFAVRNKESLDKLANKELGQACRALLALRGDARTTLAALKMLSERHPCLARLSALWQLVEQTIDAADLPASLFLTLDPLETRGFFYHDSFAFTLLCHTPEHKHEHKQGHEHGYGVGRGARGALGRGGSYHSPEPACGCSFYLDAFAEVVASPPRRLRIYAAFDATRAAVRRHRDEGDIVVQALSEQSPSETARAAKGHACSQILRGDDRLQELP